MSIDESNRQNSFARSMILFLQALMAVFYCVAGIFLILKPQLFDDMPVSLMRFAGFFLIGYGAFRVYRIYRFYFVD